jgi:hypothetical protein
MSTPNAMLHQRRLWSPERSVLMTNARRETESREKTMVICDAFKFVAVVLLGMVGSLSLSVAQPATCDVLDVRCPVSNSVWSGSLNVTATSTPLKPPSLCLKISRSLSLIPGTSDGDGCVQLVGVLERTAVTGHYCRSNRAINLFRVMPDSSVELQPDILIGIATDNEIQGRFFVKETNDPNEGFSATRGFKLRRVDACQTN